MNAPPSSADVAAARLIARARSPEAASRFRDLGLPSPRLESWHYTHLRPLLGLALAEPPDIHDDAALALLPPLPQPAHIFVNGRSTTPRDPAGGDAHDNDVLDVLNAMLARDGAEIAVPAGEDGGTRVLASLGDTTEDSPISFHPRHQVTLGEGARLVLIEVATGRGRYLHNPAFSVTLGAGANLLHLRLQDEAAEAFCLSTLHATVAAGARYDSFALALGGRLSRLQVDARLTGPGASAHIAAAQLLGDQQHADVTTVIGHEAPGCASRQSVRHVVGGRARSVFQGRIEVARIAQKTDGYQMSQALLLSPDAEIDCKPQLQIYADDVKCSHGATVGELDPEQLFYLRSRGVPETEARAALVRAFLADALSEITHDAGRSLLERAVERWWDRQP